MLGQPKVTTLDYEMDGDLHAVIEFGVRPEIILEDLTDESIDTMVHTVTDEEVEEEIQRLLEGQADLIPLEEEPIEDGDFVVFDVQEVDAATRTPIIGKRDDDQQLVLDDPRLEETLMMSALKAALLGAKVGDTVHYHFEHDKAHGGLVESVEHAHFFEATVKEVKRRDVPELDDDFVQEYTDDRLETAEAFREEVEKQIKDSWERRSQDFMEENIINRMQELHPVAVPESVVDVYVESYVEDVKRRNQGQLPPNFSVEAFKEVNRADAERQARWMLIRDKLIDDEELEVSDADVDAFFEEEAGKDDNLTDEQLRQFYAQVGLLDSVKERLLSRKVMDFLAGQFTLVEKDSETLERELEERRAQALAEAEAAAAEAEAAAAALEAATAAAAEAAEAIAEVKAPEAEATEAEVPEAEAPEAETMDVEEATAEESSTEEEAEAKQE